MTGDITFWGWLLGILVPTFFVLGGLSALDAVMKARTPQGSTAWAISLITVPFIALPFYWIFGRTHFSDYEKVMDDFNRQIAPVLAQTGVDEDGPLQHFRARPSGTRGEPRAFQKLATTPFTDGNDGHLLIDGHATFDAIFDAIDRAEDYVLAQFYIIHDDEIGCAFQAKLAEAARRGVRVYLLYDGVGCYKLPHAYLRALRDAGATPARFIGAGGALRRFRLNFRNHRKIVVVDGKRAFVGGLNVGDEYLGRDPDLSPWRDTHLRIDGPAVLGVQLTYLRDWYYANREVLDVRWQPQRSAADRCALVLASGPNDELETCGLLFAHAIESAERRVWIASPYFVPDGRVLGALQLAALRGVDVRILMPRKSDSVFFKYVPYAYLDDVARAGVRVFLYEDGFMHQKVVLVDEEYAAVGTANLDNRSFRLNFEINILYNDGPFARDVAAMLERDLARATEITLDDIDGKSLFFQLATQVTRLFAPVL